MYSSVVFLIFATGMVLARSIDDARSKRENNFTKILTVDCSTDHGRELRNFQRNVSCQPYYRHVDLNPMPGQLLTPPSVFVRRCYGHVDPTTVCAPKSTGIKIIRVPVSVNSGPQQNQCGVVEVEEHLGCEIKCKHGPESCNAEQEYIQSRCGCKCKNQDELRRECNARDGRKWDDENCKCTCMATSRDCTTESEWNETTCKCQLEG